MRIFEISEKEGENGTKRVENLLEAVPIHLVPYTVRRFGTQSLLCSWKRFLSSNYIGAQEYYT